MMFNIETQSQSSQRLYPKESIIEQGHVICAETWVYAKASPESSRITQYTFGEPLGVMIHEKEMLYVQSLRDNYCGWIDANVYKKDTRAAATHITRFNAPVTAEASLKSQIILTLPRDSLFSPDDEQDDYLHIPDLGWVHYRHIAPRDALQPIEVTATQLLYQSYVWGGRGVAGLDCSALSQLCYRWAGKRIPRDADLQMIFLKKHHLNVDVAALQCADLVFIPGHVMVMINDQEVIHASGYDMRVVQEPLAQALERYKQSLGASYQLQAYRWKSLALEAENSSAPDDES